MQVTPCGLSFSTFSRATAAGSEPPADLFQPSAPQVPQELKAFRNRTVGYTAGATVLGAGLGQLWPTAAAVVPTLGLGTLGLAGGAIAALLWAARNPARQNTPTILKALAIGCLTGTVAGLVGGFAGVTALMHALPGVAKPIAGAVLWGATALGGRALLERGPKMQEKLKLYQSELASHGKQVELQTHKREALPQAGVQETLSQVAIGGVRLRKRALN